MDELEAFGREMAKTSTAWIVPGVELFNFGQGEHGRVYLVEYEVVYCITRGLRLAKYLTSGPIRPNLADPVTVNALLGQGMVWPSRLGFTARICLDGEREESSRTTAIARAWIAAHGKEKAHG
jgi:hypothetical protein